MAGFGDLFAGLVEGIGETTQKLQKDKKDREERDKAQQLDLFKTIMAHPGIDADTKNQAFRSALEIAGGGNKKLVDSVHGMLGPILAGEKNGQQSGQQQSPAQGQTPAPAQPVPSLGDGGQSKFGPPQRHGAFYTPEELTQQDVSRAQAMGNVQVDQNLRQAQGVTDIQNKAALAQAQAMIPVKVQEQEAMAKAAGFPDHVGFKKGDDGWYLISRNPSTGQLKESGPIQGEFMTQGAMDTAGSVQAKSDVDMKQAADTVLWASGVNPKTATPEQRAHASQQASAMQVEADKAGTTLKNSSALAELIRARATAQGEKGLGGLTDNQVILLANSQQQQYEKRGNDIQKVQDNFDKEMEQAEQKTQLANSMEMALNARKVKRGDSDPQLAGQSYTWENRDQLMQQVIGHYKTAKELAKSAKSRFGDDVDVQGIDATLNKDGGYSTRPYLRNNQQDFQFKMPQGLPEMPSDKRKRERGGKNSTIDVDPKKWGIKF